VRVVFLDFDGVLNSGPYTDAMGQDPNFQPRELSMEWWAQGLDPVAIEHLNSIVERTDAKVVVSSTWRLHATIGWLQRVLRLRGYRHRVRGKTERCAGYDRSYEIQMWLAKNPTSHFVILDDRDDAGIAGHFVRTDPEVGLTAELVEKAVEILLPSTPIV